MGSSQRAATATPASAAVASLLGAVGSAMAQPAGELNPRSFSRKLHSMVALVLADCGCSAFGDFFWHREEDRANLVLCIGQIVLHLCSVVLFFMLLSYTFLMRYGLLGEAWTEFR